MEQRRIRKLRAGLDLSQERFAQLLGVSLQTVRRWESGLTRPLPIISLKLSELEQQAQVQLRIGGPEMGEENTGPTAKPWRFSTKSEGQGIGLDIGLGLGGLFKGMGSLLEVVDKMAEEGREETTKTGTVEAMGGKVKGVYGFTVRLGVGGKPVVEQFGNIRETPSGAVVTQTREPLVDVLDEGDHILVIAEIPGIEEGDVRVKVEGDILEIAASRGARQYHKEVLLPTAAAPQNVATSYKNGILEVRLAKVQSGQG